MIKILKNKFLICLFLLVTVFSVTRSCYATLNTTVTESPFTKEDIFNGANFKSFCSSNGLSIDINNSKILAYYNASRSNNYKYEIYVIYSGYESISYLNADTVDSHTDMYDSSGTKLTTKINYITGSVDSTGNFQATYLMSKGSGSSISYTWTASQNNYTISILDITEFEYKLADEVIYNYSSVSVDVTHEFQNDTSAKINFAVNNAPDGAYLQYSLTGVEISTDLNAPLKLKNPVTYSPGVTNLVVKPNTKVYWALYDSSGEVLETNVYQVPEYDSIIENSDKSIEYSVTYNENNSLATLTVNVINGEFSDKLYYTENGMVSNDYAGKQLFPASKSLQIDHNCNMHIILYDPFDNLITAKYVTINKIGSIPEQNFKVDVTTGDKTVYVRPRLYNVLQSRFYSIEYDVVLDTFTSSKDIELHQDGVYVGKVTDTSQTLTCGSDSELKFYQNIGTSNITVTFRIINSETKETCITRTVSFKIGLDDESTGVTDSTTNGVTDNSFITSGTNSNYSDVANMGISDYYNMVNTNNTAWSFFKVILNSLPNWITLPLSLLIFGVVTITLYRFIRGA